MPPALSDFDEDDILAPEPFDIAPCRKRRAPHDLLGSEKKRQRSGEKSAESNATLDVALDNVFTALRDKPDNSLYVDSARQAADCMVDRDGLDDAIKAPLQRLISAVEKRCGDGDPGEEQRLPKILGKMYAERVIAQLGKCLVDTIDLVSGSFGLRTIANANGYKLEVRLTPVLNLEDSDDEETRLPRRRYGSPRNEDGASLKFHGTHGRQIAVDDSGIDLGGMDVEGSARRLAEGDDGAMAGAAMIGAHEVQMDEEAPEKEGEEGEEGEDDDDEDEALLETLVIYDSCTDTVESPFQVRNGTIGRPPNLLAPEKCLVLRPHPTSPAQTAVPTAAEARDKLETTLGQNAGLVPSIGLTGVRTMDLAVADSHGVSQPCQGTFLVEFSDITYASRARGQSVMLWQQVFTLEKLHLGPHRYFFCQNVPSVGRAKVSRSQLIHSLMACFVPQITLRVKIGKPLREGNPENTCDVLVELGQPVAYEQLSFELRTTHRPVEMHKLTFRPLEGESKARCVVCSSNGHFTEKCPQFRPVLLENASGLNQRVVATARELRRSFEHHALVVEEESEDDAADLDDPSGSRPTQRSPPRQNEDLQESKEKQILHHNKREKAAPCASPEPVRGDGVHSKTRTLQDYCHWRDDATPFAIRKPSAVQYPYFKSADSKLVLTLLSGRTFEGDLPAVEKAIREVPKTGLQEVRQKDGVYFALCTNADMAEKAAGRVIGMEGRSFRLDEYSAEGHRVYSCRGVTFGSNGVSRVAALHSILTIIPGQDPLCVFLRQTTNNPATRWRGDLMVVTRRSQPMKRFSFDLPVRKHDQASDSSSTLRFFPEVDDGKICPWCTALSPDHRAEHCRQFKSLLLDDGRGTHSRLYASPTSVSHTTP